MSEQHDPCVAGLFTDQGGAQILGARCETCNTPYFPVPSHCRNPRCEASNIVRCSFGGQGVLWSFAVADFPPPAPHRHDEPFTPYVIGIVDLDDGLRLVGQMIDGIDQVQVGARVEVVIAPLYHEADKAFTTWKFKLV